MGSVPPERVQEKKRNFCKKIRKQIKREEIAMK